MLRFDLSYESDDPAEVEAIAEAVVAVASAGTLVIRSTGTSARYRLLIALKDLDGETFRTDLAAILTVVPPLLHEFDPVGHWRLARVPDRSAA